MSENRCRYELQAWIVERTEAEQMGLVVSGVGQCALVPNFHYNAPNATVFDYTVESRTRL